MRRFLCVGAALTVLATFTIAGAAGGSTRGSHSSAMPAAPAATPHETAHGFVHAGSTWTLYYRSWNSMENFCEILTFESAHAFSGDRGSVGTWKGNISLKFTTSDVENDGDTYQGKYNADGFLQAGFYGTVTDGGAAWGPFILQAGSDPESAGDC